MYEMESAKHRGFDIGGLADARGYTQHLLVVSGEPRGEWRVDASRIVSSIHSNRVRDPLYESAGATWKTDRIASSREDKRESTGRLWTWLWSFRSIAAAGARGAAAPRTVLSIPAIRSGRRLSVDTTREPTGTFEIRTGLSSCSGPEWTAAPGSPGSEPGAGGGPAGGWTWTRIPEPNRSWNGSGGTGSGF